MNGIPAPSTAWEEKVAPDEAERFANHARLFTQIQEARRQRWGPGRAVHRKQLAAAHGTLEVLDGLPDFARHGLFARPHHYEVLVRLSNGSSNRAADFLPDVRGFAIRVLGVQGPSAVGDDPATSQDFTLINQETFPFADSGEFVAFVVAASRGYAALLWHFFKGSSLLGALRRIVRTIRVLGRPFSGFATESLFSAAPMANGPYAVRVRLVPAASNGPAKRNARKDWGADFGERLARQPLRWDLQLQYFVSETLTPIEDASVDWPTPYTTVARLTLPQQDAQSEAGQRTAGQAEAGVITPWHALADHRPLGEIQRARKVVYLASRIARGAV